MMNEQRFETGKSPQVTVGACTGALVVGSWKGAAVLAQGSQFSAETVEVDHIALSSDGDLTLTVPEKASLTIDSVTGALTVKHVDGRIAIGHCGGDITLNDVGRVAIKNAAGSLKGENINESFTISQAQQSVSLRNVTDVGIKEAANSVAIQFANGAILLEKVGQVSLQTISGDVIVREAAEAVLGNLGGKNEIGGVKGTIQLTGGLANGEHHFAAEGDILVAWPIDGPITLVAEAAIINNQLSLANAATTKLDDGRTQLTGNIEQGKPFVSLKTTANIGLKSLRPGEAALSAADFDFTLPPPTLDEVVATAVSTAIPTATPAQIEQIADMIDDHLEVKEEITPPSIPSAGQIAAAKAQKKTEKSLEKAKGAIIDAQNRLTQPPSPKAAAPKPKTKTKTKTETETEAEAEPEAEMESETAVAPSQTQILKLLKDGLITIEQANVLLNQLPKD